MIEDAKVIEIRDRGTFVPAVAVRLTANTEAERYLLRRAGWSAESAAGVGPNVGVMLYPLTGNRAYSEPYGWGGRTYPVVHQHLIDNWDAIDAGAVVDVEFILGETSAPKESERYTHGG